MDNTLKIAIPNKGRLSTKIYELLNNAGLSFGTKDERCLKIATRDGKYSLIFVRTQDIPRFLDAKVADVGFTGWDVVVEEGVELDKVKDFDFGACEMVVAVKDEDTYKTPSDLPNEINVATSFPNIAKKYFESLGKKAKIIEVSGVIVARKNLEEDKQKKLNSLIRALDSVIDAQEKKYLMVHVPKNKIEEVKSFMPGLSSPTVTQLWGDSENVVIHVVVDKDKVYDSIDHLKSIGGKGILILTVDQMVK